MLAKGSTRICGLAIGGTRVEGAAIGDTKVYSTKSLSLNYAGATTVTLGFKLSNGGTYDVDWGDGTAHSAGTSSTYVNVTHTYASAYTGVVKIKYSACSYIQEFRAPAGQLIIAATAIPQTATSVSITWTGSVVSGNVSDLSKALTYLVIGGSNTLSGNVADLSKALTYLYIGGSNTLSGLLTNLQLNLLTYIYIGGQNTVTTATQPIFATSMQYAHLAIASATAVRAQAVTDMILAGLAQVATWTAEKSVILNGVNAAPSAAGLANKAIIAGKGVTVTTN